MKYFEFKVKEAGNKLNAAEEKLLRFNQSNNIVNYEDQSRAAASSKSSLITELQNNRIKMAGQEATASSWRKNEFPAEGTGEQHEPDQQAQ